MHTYQSVLDDILITTIDKRKAALGNSNPQGTDPIEYPTSSSRLNTDLNVVQEEGFNGKLQLSRTANNYTPKNIPTINPSSALSTTRAMVKSLKQGQTNIINSSKVKKPASNMTSSKGAAVTSHHSTYKPSASRAAQETYFSSTSSARPQKTNNATISRQYV